MKQKFRTLPVPVETQLAASFSRGAQT